MLCSNSLKVKSEEPILNPIRILTFNSWDFTEKIYVKICLNTGKSDLLLFLVDTGADISVLKELSIEEGHMCYPELKCQIKGITEQYIETCALLPSKIIFNESFHLDHDFHIVNQDFPIACDGILGKDFFSKYSCKIDFETNCLEIPLPEFCIELDLINVPQKVIIPPRSENITSIAVNLKNNCEYICTSMEVITGVFVGNTIVKPLNNVVTINIINSTEQLVEIDANNLNFKNLSDFDIYTLNNPWTNKIESRLTLLKSMIDTSHLNTEEAESINSICQEFNEVFHLKGDVLTTTCSTEHSIPLKPGTLPIYQKPYRLPHSLKTEINRQVDEMLNNKIIQVSESPWNSPILAVPKKSVTNEKQWRVVVDYRRLNDVTLDRVFPLPNITDIFDQLGKAFYFTTLDMADGYHQVQMSEPDKLKTAFSTELGHYHFNRMPFGLKGAPYTFQSMMNRVLTGIQGTKCLVYLDDIIIFGQNLSDHNKKLIDVLRCLQSHNLKLNPFKCQFLRNELRYLGHIIGPEGIKPDPVKIDSVVNYPRPNTPKEIKSFLGLAGYYRRFIKNFSAIALPLVALLKKNTEFIWNAKCDEAFGTLKKAITSPPILQYPNFNKMFTITTDASSYAIGSVLSQDVNSIDLPVAFASRTLTVGEQHYSTI